RLVESRRSQCSVPRPGRAVTPSGPYPTNLSPGSSELEALDPERGRPPSAGPQPRASAPGSAILSGYFLPTSSEVLVAISWPAASRIVTVMENAPGVLYRCEPATRYLPLPWRRIWPAVGPDWSPQSIAALNCCGLVCGSLNRATDPWNVRFTFASV